MFGRSRKPRLGSELVCGTEVAGGGLGILSNRLEILLPQVRIKLVHPLQHQQTGYMEGRDRI
jgi:hypothetical protein